MVHAFARRAAVVLAITAIIATAGCTVHNKEVPAVSGPSALALTLTVNAIPDSLSFGLNGPGDDSSIKVTAIGPDGKLVSDLPIRLNMMVDGVAQDYGTLDRPSIVTKDGVATAVYTAPASPPNGLFGTCAGLPGTCVEIVAAPTGTNFQTSVSQSVRIRLVPRGIILPPAGTPTAAFTFSPQPAAANLPLQFDASTSQPGTGAGQIVSYNWTFGDGTSATGKTATHTFAASNIYNVTLTVTNDRNLSASTTQPVSVVGGALPTPTFTVSPAAPAVSEPVFFNAATSTAGSGHSIAAYRWTFGDGSTGSGVSTSHVYTTAGTYTVQLTVTDDVGLSATSTGTQVTIGNQGAPTANFTVSPTSPAAGDSVIFDYRSSTIVNGQAIVALDWNFGDGTTPVHCPGNAACAADGITTHVFTRAGTFIVALVTTDAAGRTGTRSTPVTVTGGGAGTAPTATFTFSPANPGVVETVFFNASTSAAGAGHTIASYAWTFGDGATATGVTVSHAYSTAGSYSVQLKVTDEAGQSTTSAASTIPVGAPPAPTANFTFSVTTPVVGQQVVFDASSSTTSQGQTIVDVAWNFGDGTAVIHCGGILFPNDASCVNVGVTNRISAHTFASAATFVVNLVVTDSAGRIGSRSASVTVGTGNPVPVITFSPASPKAGVAVTFDSAGTTTSGGATITTYAWTFPGAVPALSALSSQTVTYAVANTYLVRLTVTDSQNRVGTTTVSVVVVP